MPEAENPYEQMPKTLAPPGEGAYTMTDAGGKAQSVPLGSLGYWAQQGYTIKPEEKERYTQDFAKKHNLAIVGRNDMGDAILGPALPEQSDKSIPGMAGRLLKAAGATGRLAEGVGGNLWDTATGMWHAVTAPATQEEHEKGLDKNPGDLAVYRMTAGPMEALWNKADQMEKDIKAKGQSVGDLHNPDVLLYWKNRIASVIPMFGPMIAGTTDVMGEKLHKGDFAGALGYAIPTALALRGGPEVAERATKMLPAKVAEAAGWNIPFVPRAGVGKFMTEKLPRQLITRVIRPMSGDIKFGKDPVAAILDEGITGNNLPELNTAVKVKLDEVGKKLDDLATSPANQNKIVDVSDSLKPFDDAIAEAHKANNASLYAKLLEQRQRLQFEWQPDSQGVLRPYQLRNMKMTPAQALEYKRWIGDQVKWTNEPLEGQVVPHFGAAYGKVKDALDAKVPGMRELNQRYANLVGAKKAITRREPVEARKSEFPLSRVAFLASGHWPLAVAEAIAETPGFRTTLGKLLYKSRPLVPVARAASKGARAVGLGAQTTGQGQRQDKSKPSAGVNPYDVMPKSLPPVEASPYADMPTSLPPAGGASTVTISRIMSAISQAEGYGTPDTVPTRANNPGALENGDVGYGTMPAAKGQKITIYPTGQDGWDALEKKIIDIYGGRSKTYAPTMTLSEFGKTYSGNDPTYGARIAATLGVDPSITLSDFAGASAQPEATPAPTQAMPQAQPLPALKQEAAQRKPSPSVLAPQTAPENGFTRTATAPNGHKIGTYDGSAWFDVETGEQTH